MSTRSTWERQRIILFCLCVDQYYIGLQCINQSFPGCLLTVRNYTKKWLKQFEIWQHCDDDVSLCQMSLTTCYIPRTEGSNKQYAAISSSVCPSSVCPMPLIQNGAFKGCVYSLLQNANTGCRTHRSARPQRGRTAPASGRNRRGRRGTDRSAATGTRDVLLLLPCAHSTTTHTRARFPGLHG